ncbi:ALBINO3-like protein 2, chloroplastic [Melia azedarach]|uniref:ALBINO3-like protein 2, chloroplastic n=1 Tax=Melia azedarach TaxID=155640 RepID=A0ACC1XCY3_MELAZ|nr:ALBINO3-like protein 2, chloroplastic [Melia azedarach]
MATSKLLLSQLRRCSHCLTRAPVCHLFHAPIPTQTPPSSYCFRSPVHFFHSRSVDDFNNNSDTVTASSENIKLSDGVTESFVGSATTPSEIINLSEGVIGTSGAEESILPVRTLISLLDAYHDFTGFPWWIIIASSTLAFRFALLPVLVLQLKKIQRIGELFPKLPPPFPPPLSGRSFIDQISHFRRERKAVGCPSFLWFLASFSIQVPCFLLGVTSIRRMSLDGHPGFDCGGTLWFQNLTEFPHGLLGSVFPVLIAGLHFTNIQISFRSSSLGKESGLFGSLAEYYKLYLKLLTVPLFFVGYCIPQGSLVYWVTNSSFSVIQQLSLKHPAIRSKLGLPDKHVPAAATKSGESDGETNLDSPAKQRKISVKELAPKELLATHLQKGLLAEAVEYLERAISKLFHAGHPTESEDIDLLIVASQWAGVACIRQGKWAEGIVHLERIGDLKEPEEPRAKAHYYDGLVVFSSALSNVGRKAEAAKYLRLAAAYNPEYNQLLEQLENDDGEFVSDLSSSRRRDY